MFIPILHTEFCTAIIIHQECELPRQSEIMRMLGDGVSTKPISWRQRHFNYGLSARRIRASSTSPRLTDLVVNTYVGPDLK